MFGILSYRSQIISEGLKELPETIYRVWEEKDEMGRGRTLENDLGLNDQSIWCHTHRMYLIGSNSVRFPWFIPKDFPRDALMKPDREKLLAFIDRINKDLRWGWIEKFTFVLVKVCYFPVAKGYH